MASVVSMAWRRVAAAGLLAATATRALSGTAARRAADLAPSTTANANAVARAESAQKRARRGQATEVAPQQWKTELGHVSGQPPVQAARHVHIYSPAKSAMQSGTFQTRYWKIAFDTQERWENPLMGWTSSADPLQAVDLTMRFHSKEAAVQFAEKNGAGHRGDAGKTFPGWAYSVENPKRRNVALKRTYGDNFRYEPGKLRIVKTK